MVENQFTNQVSPIHKSRVTTLGIQLSPTRDQPPSQGRKAFGVSHRICDQQSSPRLLVKANSNRSSREGLINMTDTAVLDIGLALTWPWRAENISVLPSGSVTACSLQGLLVVHVREDLEIIFRKKVNARLCELATRRLSAGSMQSGL